MNRLIRFILRKTGVKSILNPRQKNDSLRLDHSHEALEDVVIIKDSTMLSLLKLVTLYEKVAYCEQNKIEGALVECGVWKGGSVGMMALANLRFGNHRRDIHLFDAFDDICEPDPVIDGQQAIEDVEMLLGRKVTSLSGKLAPIKGVYDTRGGHGTIKECENLLIGKIKYDPSHLYFHKGWFQETLLHTSQNLGSIAILRLDADWYESTKVCLHYLYDKVVQGGFVIIDDYGRYDGCKKAVDEFLEQKNISVFLNYSDYNVGECRYFIKP